ncbi:unnamed protein product [Moneuplotes crassus]|uniref:Uncharacterized protein n=1 Tax=Euplotes crassus TaxID=5936 RepID=A0AAD1XMG8_EUPCR|nr:unnamed protein product [Moneuplotes crassus]
MATIKELARIFENRIEEENKRDLEKQNQRRRKNRGIKQIGLQNENVIGDDSDEQENQQKKIKQRNAAPIRSTAARNQQPKISNKAGVIGDSSSDEEEDPNAKFNNRDIFKKNSPVVIGGDEPELPRYVNKTKPKVTTHKRVVIGDDSSDEDTNKFINNQKPKIATSGVIGDIDDSDEEKEKEKMSKIRNSSGGLAPDPNYADQLSSLYAQKKVIKDQEIEAKERKLKKYYEEKKYKDFTKLADSSDEEDANKEDLDMEELWSKFAQKHIEKPVMKGNKRRQKKKGFEL